MSRRKPNRPTKGGERKVWMQAYAVEMSKRGVPSSRAGFYILAEHYYQQGLSPVDAAIASTSTLRDRSRRDRPRKYQTRRFEIHYRTESGRWASFSRPFASFVDAQKYAHQMYGKGAYVK